MNLKEAVIEYSDRKTIEIHNLTLNYSYKIKENNKWLLDPKLLLEIPTHTIKVIGKDYCKIAFIRKWN